MFISGFGSWSDVRAPSDDAFLFLLLNFCWRIVVSNFEGAPT
jgi:hypothetical protein